MLKQFSYFVFFLVLTIYACQSGKKNNKIDKTTEYKELYSIADSLGNINLDVQDSVINELIKVAEETKNDSLIIQAYLLKTKALIDLQLFEEALNINNKTAQLCLNTKDSNFLILNKYNLGLIYLQTYKCKEAIEIFNELRSYYLRNNNTLKLINSTANIGWAYYYNLQYNNAIKYTKEAIQISNQNNVNIQLGDLFQRLAVLFVEIKELDSSEYYFAKSNEAYIHINNYIGQAYNINNMGGLFYHAKAFDKAINYYQKALKLFDSLGMGNEIGNVYNNIGISYKDKGNYEQAETYLNKALKEVELIENKSLKASIYKNLALLYSSTKEYQKSSQYYKKHIDAYSEFTDENNHKILEELNIKYENSKKEKLISDLNNQKLEVDKKFNLTFSLISIIVVVFGFSLMMYLQKKKKIELLTNIKNQKNELEKIKLAEENERQRIGKNLHDNMGAYATSIIAGVDNLLEHKNYDFQTIENIKNNANQMLVNLRENITILNNKESSLMETIDQFKQFAIKIMQNYEHIDYEFNDNITNDFKLNAVKVVHLQSVLSEMLHNAIKHSQCKSISFLFSEENGKYHIGIVDDGIGFNPENSTIGNGFKNLKWRAEQLNAEFIIHSNENGTKVSLVLN